MNDSSIMIKSNQDKRGIKVLICTSNLGNAKPTKSSIESWVPFDGVINTDSPYPLPDLSDGILDEEKGSPFTKTSESDLNYREDNQFDIIAIGMQEATFSQGDEKQGELVVSDEKALKTSSSSIVKLTAANFRRSTEVLLGDPVQAINMIGAKTMEIGTDLANKTVNHIHGTTDKIVTPFHAVGADANHLLTNDLLENPATVFGGTRVLHKLIMDQCPSYQCVMHYQRGEMRLMILIPKNKLANLSSIECVAGNTGIGKFLPNKGGIVAHLCMYDTRLSFITAHLAAHEGHAYYTNRCDNMRQILSQARLSTKYPNAFDASILSHYAFVFGDLNFRVQLPITGPIVSKEEHHEEHVQKVLSYIDKKNWAILNKHDELFKAVKQEEFCVGFKTLPCHFPPTFKLERKEGFEYKSQRSPSYTDRILWKAAHGLSSNIKPLYYEPCPFFVTSDHKPMRGAFSISLSESPSPQNKFAEEMKCHIFITDMSCTSLNIKGSDTKVTLNEAQSTYLTFLTSPVELLPNIKDKNISFDKFKSWPKTSKNKTNPINPTWKNDDEFQEAEEVHFTTTPSIHPQTSFLNSFLYISAVNSLPAQEDYVIGTVALDLYEILSQDKIYDACNVDAFKWEEFYDNTLTPSAQLTNTPLKKNGLTQGYLNCKIVMAWYYADDRRNEFIGATRKDIERNHKMSGKYWMKAVTRKLKDNLVTNNIAKAFGR